MVVVLVVSVKTGTLLPTRNLAWWQGMTRFFSMTLIVTRLDLRLAGEAGDYSIAHLDGTDLPGAFAVNIRCA